MILALIAGSGVTRGLSQGGKLCWYASSNGHRLGNAIISSQKFTYITYIWAWASEEGPRPSVDFQNFSNKTLFS